MLAVECYKFKSRYICMNSLKWINFIIVHWIPDDRIRTFQCQSRADDDFLCEQEHNISFNATCGHKSGDISKCNVSITNVPFCDQHHSPSMPTTDKPTTPAECKCTSTSVSENSVSEATAVVSNTGCSTSNSSNLIIALGTLVGLLLVLLVIVIIVSTVLAWTYWKLKRRGGMKSNTEYELR